MAASQITKKRILIVAATTGYQTRSFESAAREMDLEVILATDRCHELDNPWGDNAVPIRFEQPHEAPSILSEHPRPDGVIAVGDRPTVIAAIIAKALGLPYHPVEAVEICRNKHAARERFRAAGLLVPEYFRVPVTFEPAEAARSASYPCVLKPLGLSGSRGVIRADDDTEFVEAFHRIRALLETPDICRLQDETDRYIQIETFIPGVEFAVEGLVTAGELQVLALFDKPDPLDGPFFEESIYVTPSRASQAILDDIVETTRKAVRALGLTHGPVHAEMRHKEKGTWMLEVAARPIGGLCSQCLRLDRGVSLEQLILKHALGENVRGFQRETGASGVMMIPIPENGIYLGVSGTEHASAVTGVDSVIITAKHGQRLRQLPEGASYLGFIFARGDEPQEVESALREAHGKLRFEIARELDQFLLRGGT
jgi:biotin carboxylase